VSINYDKNFIKKLFRTKLKKKLAAMESERKALKNKGGVFALTAICALIMAIVNPNLFFSLNFANLDPQDFFVLIGLIWVALFIYFMVQYNKYRKKFKHQIIKEVIQAVLPGSTYTPDGYVPRSDYQKSSFFLTSENRFGGEDLITHQYKGINYQFSELTTKKVTGSGKNKSTKIIFRGIFLTCELPYKIKYRTLILPDLGEKMFGRMIGKFFQSKNITRDELVKLEDVDFEKNFVVYSKDQIEARKILTPRMMAKILDYDKKTNHTIHLCFEPGKLYMAIPMRKNYFEPNLTSGIKYKDIRDVCDIIHTITSIIDVLEIENTPEK
jgi:hypothetical protein